MLYQAYRKDKKNIRTACDVREYREFRAMREYTHTQASTRELVDLRVGYANPSILRKRKCRAIP